jgi:hypothetical protein
MELLLDRAQRVPDLLYGTTDMADAYSLWAHLLPQGSSPTIA